MCARAARELIFKTQSLDLEKGKKFNIISLLAERENRACESCNKLTEVKFRRKPRTPFLVCINCGKTQDLKKRTGSNLGYEKKNTKGQNKMTGAVNEEERFCPEHTEKVKLNLKMSRYGAFYSCSEWKRDKSGCNYTEKIKK